jgi:hypothetical protein
VNVLANNSSNIRVVHAYVLLAFDGDYYTNNYITTKIRENYYKGNLVTFSSLPRIKEFCKQYTRTYNRCDLMIKGYDGRINIYTADYSRNNSISYLNCGYYLSIVNPGRLYITVRLYLLGYCFHEMNSVVNRNCKPKITYTYWDSINECQKNPHCRGVSLHDPYNIDVDYRVYSMIFGNPFKCDDYNGLMVWTDYSLLLQWKSTIFVY